ncbi:hypothetical protein [Bartonella koehlerae]|uniref:Uncharacterized protein n=1 Tax=Bartonella koehlerae C-29 TaxID=1134510 RepID=A0A067WFE3_9HYPH|nr:hypothetical protein [Bartonella koehlerae]KEC55498.1 hypothetical protein O9A_00778 [Bartonella koehlerae C-29]
MFSSTFGTSLSGSCNFWGNKRDQDKGIRAAWIMSRFRAIDLIKFGINANCLPVLDILVGGTHDVIGTRAYAKGVETVIALGCAITEGLLDGGFYR